MFVLLIGKTRLIYNIKLTLFTRNTIFAVTREARVKGKHRLENRREGRVVFERRNLAKNNDMRQTSYEVKPGWAGLVPGWVTTFKQKPLC